MKAKSVLGLVILVGGIALMAISNYIMGQVEEGKAKISDAENKVDTGNALFSLSPVTKEVGKGVTGSAQKKINAGKEKVAEYENLAGWLKTGGIILIAAGTIVVLVSIAKRFPRR